MSFSAIRATSIRRMMTSTAKKASSEQATAVKSSSSASAGITRQTTKTMSQAERDAVLHEANEKMRQYHMNRPPLELLKQKKHEIRSINSRQQKIEHGTQLSLMVAFFIAFVGTPFLGHRIASDEEFRNKYIPSWYDYSIEKPKSAWTRQELHDQVISVQSELHERAIRGEFTPEKLDQMRRHFDGVDPENDPHGWGKLHPGIDDDDDIEDE